MLIQFPEVAELIGRPADRATRLYLWRMAKAGTLVPVQVSVARIAWKRAEVLALIETLPRVRYGARDSVAAHAS